MTLRLGLSSVSWWLVPGQAVLVGIPQKRCCVSLSVSHSGPLHVPYLLRYQHAHCLWLRQMDPSSAWVSLFSHFSPPQEAVDTLPQIFLCFFYRQYYHAIPSPVVGKGRKKKRRQSGKKKAQIHFNYFPPSWFFFFPLSKLEILDIEDRNWYYINFIFTVLYKLTCMQ